MQTCPICKKTVEEQKHWVNCPRVENIICIVTVSKNVLHRGEDHCAYNKEIKRR